MMSMCRKRMLLAVLVTSALLGAYAAPNDQMSVQVRETQVRSTPSFMGKVLATLEYGERVEVTEKSRGWARVDVPGGGGSGWVNLSALSEKRIVLKAGSADVDKTASGGEVALAGKGFNEQVEARYESQNDLDYTWIDRMEGYDVPVSRRVSFLLEGGLSPSVGGSQ